MNKILVLFDSKTGNVARMAQLVGEGAREVPQTLARPAMIPRARAAETE